MAKSTRSFTNEDCMEVMARYPDNHFDLAIVDPPYGSSGDAINRTSSESKKVAKRQVYKEFKNEAPEHRYFDELIRVSKNQIIWGVNFFDYRFTGGRIVWDKKGTAFGRAEMAFCSKTKSVNIFEWQWNGMLQQKMKNKEARIHPTQKPVALYKWLLSNYAKEGDLILDTHVGSASSLIACEDKGFNYVGCELDPDYFRDANKRLAKFRSQPKLDFSPQPKPIPVQLSIT